ncbi:MAG: DUF3307 domain-containing protein [Chloroflexi bacterium]|nr:DUF3307 domain-containing protein [Chloroflexota bacterium]
MADTILVLAWLVLAHLAADFILQSASIAAAKSGHGSRALAGLFAHGWIVAAVVVPVGFAFGERGWWFVLLTGLSHIAIDRAKVVLTRRAAAAALREAHDRHEAPRPPEHLGRAWTPQPAALFLADQGAHLAAASGGWAVLLAGVPLDPGWTAAIDGWLGSWDRVAVHGVASAAVVLIGLAIVNIRAASLFVGILVRPVEVTAGGEHRWGGRVAPAPDPDIRSSTSAAQAPVGRRWSIRLGPLDARVIAEPEPAIASPASPSTPPLGGSARVGSTIGVLERILIVVFVLTGTDVAIGFVVAAKTLARFRLLDDRDFAEYYLLGTLASVAIAIVSALIGRAALGALLA